ncbi:MAGUK p55 subfamily member 2, partial [Xenoophorus captivus]
LVIARILHGGMIDQQGLLHVGDIIKEVNGKEVDNDPKVLQEMLKEASGSVVLKILPSYQEPHTPRQVAFVKCHFDYDPTHDNLIPCKEAGLSFTSGDILQIFNQEDLNWWQVSSATIRYSSFFFLCSTSCFCVSLPGLSYRGRQRRPHSEPAS